MTGESPKRLTINAPFFREIKEDHESLQKLLSELEHLTGNRETLPHHGRRFTDLIDQLVDQLALHFSLEEAYGYFELAVEDAPRLHDQAAKLRSQHGDLYLAAQRVAETTDKATTTKPHRLHLAADQFLAFHSHFKKHESAELNLIIEALNRDVGGGD
jgi:hemerythrin-like domain-containing protein